MLVVNEVVKIFLGFVGPRVYYRVNKSPSLETVLGQFSPERTLTLCSYKSPFSIIIQVSS
jgi:hypothetical protein